MSNFEYSIECLNHTNAFLKQMFDISKEKDIYFEYPHKITFNAEWMADGLILQWTPYSGYDSELVFVVDRFKEEFTIVCLEANLYKRRYNKRFKAVKEILSQETQYITPEEAFSLFEEWHKLGQKHSDRINTLRKMLKTD